MHSEERWEQDPGDHTVLGMLDDLEMQAEGLHLAERAVEVDELSAAQYAEVELVARLHATIGASVVVGTADGLQLRGRLAGAGPDWLVVDDGSGSTWFARLAEVVVINGLGSGSVPDEARPLSARLSLRSVVRGLAGDREVCGLHLRGGRTLRGEPVRVGADFVELRQDEAGELLTVPLAAVAVVQAPGGRP
jgi:hypothetical protein